MQKLIKSRIFVFILGLIVVSTTSVFAYSLIADDVGFTPRDSNWKVDNTKDAIDDLHNRINSFNVEALELNGTYIKVKIPDYVKQISSKYTYYIDNVFKENSTSDTYTFTNLNLNTTYKIKVNAYDSNDKLVKTSETDLTTLNRIWLYNDGNEYEIITGGWNVEIVDEGCTPRRGLFQKNSTNILLYNSAAGCSKSRMITVNSIDVSKYKSIYVKYYKTSISGTNVPYISVNNIASSNRTTGAYLDKFTLNNYTGQIHIANWDTYDYITEVYVTPE
ncbi:MAG: hypothetical protein IJ572_00880 [Bacilli bacterium]|nr:hypothetical protein [Bacilli bacterium]